MLCVNVRFRGIATRSLEGTLREVLSLLCSPRARGRVHVFRAGCAQTTVQIRKEVRMNEAQTLALIHTVAWPILIWALSKTWRRHDVPSESQNRR